MIKILTSILLLSFYSVVTQDTNTVNPDSLFKIHADSDSVKVTDTLQISPDSTKKHGEVEVIPQPEVLIENKDDFEDWRSSV